MKILKSNNQYRNISEFEILDTLPTQLYNLEWDGFGNVFLTESLKLKKNEKIYDINKKFRDTILKTFKTQNKSLGVCLIGEKGTGKTIDSKLIIEELDIPVILINKQIPLDIDFINFLNNINQEYCLFIDEFDKKFISNSYSDKNSKFHPQQSLLGFLDGMSIQKVLTIITTNNNIDEYLINRPSRIKYVKKYFGINEELFNIVIDDLLINKEFKEDLIKNICLDYCTIDILKSIIEEINIHNVPYSDFIDIFNFESKYSYFRVFINENNKWVETSEIIKIRNKDIWQGNVIKINDKYYNYVRINFDYIYCKEEDKENEIKLVRENINLI